MEICKNCRQLFDPSDRADLQDKHSKRYLCSWHPGRLRVTDFGGEEHQFRTEYWWDCCETYVLDGLTADGKHLYPKISPGCTFGHHVADTELTMSTFLSSQLDSLTQRLRETAAKQSLGSLTGVFVSYSHSDTIFVEWLCARFHADGIDFWRDEKDILIGDAIDKAISEGIQSNAIFLLVLSRASIMSSWVQRELDEASHEAASGKKILLPVVIEGLGKSGIPSRIRRLKHADFSSNRDAAYLNLRRAVLVHIERLASNAGS